MSAGRQPLPASSHRPWAIPPSLQGQGEDLGTGDGPVELRLPPGPARSWIGKQGAIHQWRLGGKDSALLNPRWLSAWTAGVSVAKPWPGAWSEDLYINVYKSNRGLFTVKRHEDNEISQRIVQFAQRTVYFSICWINTFSSFCTKRTKQQQRLNSVERTYGAYKDSHA